MSIRKVKMATAILILFKKARENIVQLQKQFTRRQGKITEVKKLLDFYYVWIKFYYVYTFKLRDKKQQIILQP
jgi:hypothetical protein